MNKLDQPLRDWHRDVIVNIEDEYQSLLQTLRIIDNFGLLFVRCSPARGVHLIQRIKKDMPEKNIEVLKLEKSIDNLYNEIENISRKSKIKILVIAGIEKSFTEYIKPKGDGQSYFYQKTSVPRVLGYLNLERERFRDNFDFCIIFLVRSFGLNYFIHRAPDFFDWRSGVFNYNQAEEEINLELERDIYEGLKVSTELLSQPLPQIINQSVVSYLNYREVSDAG